MILIEPKERLFYLSDPINLQTLYNYSKEEWRRTDVMEYAFPITYITPELFEIRHGWDFADDLYNSKQNIQASWIRYDENNNIVDKWTHFIFLGVPRTNNYIITDADGMIIEEQMDNNYRVNIRTMETSKIFLLNQKEKTSFSTDDCGIEDLSNNNCIVRMPFV